MNRPIQSEPPPLVSRRFSTVELLIALAALLVSAPFISPFIESILLTIVLISAVLAIAEKRWVFICAGLLALPTLLSRWIHDYRPDVMPPEVFLVGAILLILFVVVNLLRFVLRAPSVNTEVLCASISAYLLLGLLWTFGYWLVAELTPGAFSFNTASGVEQSMKGFNGLYFSFITMSTVGYGDITPVSSVARMLAAMEAVVGLLFVAVLIARLVAIYSTSDPNEN
jgi:hypothetical protein